MIPITDTSLTALERGLQTEITLRSAYKKELDDQAARRKQYQECTTQADTSPETLAIAQKMVSAFEKAKTQEDIAKVTAQIAAERDAATAKKRGQAQPRRRPVRPRSPRFCRKPRRQPGRFSDRVEVEMHRLVAEEPMHLPVVDYRALALLAHARAPRTLRTAHLKGMQMLTRRRFLQCGVGAGAALTLPWAVTSPTAAAAARRLTKYLEPLPQPGAGIVIATPVGPNEYWFTQTEIARQLHPDLPPTPLWAYDDGSGLAGQAGSFGMAVVAHSGTPVDISFTHDLPATYPAWLPVDTRETPHGDEVRLMTHLHGGFVTGNSDGNPAVTPDGFRFGETQLVHYTNQLPHMPASLLWFHDHGLGATRLNVFAGLAAAYILRDEFDTGAEPNPIGIPGGAYEIPFVIQDRQFNPDGTFLYPRSDIPGAVWIGEYFGDVMLVNGKVWPFLEVEPRMYRFRFLNGCNARILNLDLAGARMWQIGAEGGMWDVPVPVKRIVLAPAERADVLVDFRPFAGARLPMQNLKPPKPVSTPAPPLTQVMQIRVGTTISQPGPFTVPRNLPGRAAHVAGPVAKTRYLTLNEIGAETVDWVLLLNGADFEESATEMPRVGTVEDWVYINLTGDTHPMHTHLVTFQVIGRTPFDAEAYQTAYGGPFGVPGGIDPTPYATGPMEPPDPTERGFKDTVKVNPGYFTTVRAKYDLPSGVTTPQTYVYHCHILEHEDNDMMRPFTVIP